MAEGVKRFKAVYSFRSPCLHTRVKQWQYLSVPTQRKVFRIVKNSFFIVWVRFVELVMTFFILWKKYNSLVRDTPVKKCFTERGWESGMIVTHSRTHPFPPSPSPPRCLPINSLLLWIGSNLDGNPWEFWKVEIGETFTMLFSVFFFLNQSFKQMIQFFCSFS